MIFTKPKLRAIGTSILIIISLFNPTIFSYLNVSSNFSYQKVSAGAIQLEWNQTYGGTGEDNAQKMIQTSDGGFSLFGFSNSFGEGYSDFMLTKTALDGTEEWIQTYGSEGLDLGRDLLQTSNGDFVLFGGSNLFGSGLRQMLLVRTNSNGSVLWERNYGGNDTSFGTSLIQTSDGGFLLGGDKPKNKAIGSDAWLVKTDSNGTVEWDQRYEITTWSNAEAIIQTSDGGFAFTGSNMVIVKTDADGNLEWNQRYVGGGIEYGYSIIQSSDGSFILAGLETGKHGSNDMSLVKFDSHGNFEWNHHYGDDGDDVARDLIQTSDGGFLLAGQTRSIERGIDVWIIKTDSEGSVEWDQTFGGLNHEGANDIVETLDGGIALAGYTSSHGEGETDMWLLKIGSINNIKIDKDSSASATNFFFASSILLLAVALRRIKRKDPELL